jgi:hypothetical protein
MSKRTPGLPQRPRGFWPTPKEAVAPLIPYLPFRATYGEPCAGDGALISHLSELWPGGRCILSSDIAPQAPGIEELDVFDIEDSADLPGMFITNPPWPTIGQRGNPAVSIIWHLSRLAPTWALLPFDFAANEYFRHVSRSCVQIVPIGRVSWLGNGTPGKDNAAWFAFDDQNRMPTVIWARQ